MVEARLTADLPEHFARLYNPNLAKFETPLDSMGIADIDAVFELAIRTYPEELPRFEGTERNKHHLYWTEKWWKSFADRQKTWEDRSTVFEFRNSPPQVAYIPVPIHWWIEHITVPPPPPDIDVMRRRNAAWASATILLKSAQAVDQARADYQDKKHNTRRVLGHIAGITPLSKQRSEEYIEELDSEYWLSELNSRLEGWREVATLHDTAPAQDRFLPQARLSDTRSLHRRIRNGAMVPRIPRLTEAA
jgi:hypothetical protein